MGTAILLALLSPWLVLFILGSSYAGAGAVLFWLCLGTVPAVANQVFAVFMQARGLDRQVGLTLIIVVFAQLCLCWVGSFFFGAVGAAEALFLAQVATFAGLGFFILKSKGLRR